MDINGRHLVERARDANGRWTDYGYDSLGHQISQQQEGGGIAPWQWFFDAKGDLQKTIDPRGYTVNYARDPFSRVLSVSDWSGTANGVVSFAYDKFGNLAKSTDELGRITQVTYDLLDRPLTLTLPDPDGAGGNPAPIYTFEYKDGLLWKAKDPSGRFMEYLYNAAGDAIMAQQWYTNSNGTSSMLRAQNFTYTSAGQLDTATDWLGNLTNLDYDLVGRLNKITHPTVAGQVAFEEFVHNVAGELTTYKDELGRQTGFLYTPRGFLWQVNQPLGKTISMSHDGVGNILTMTDPLLKTTTFHYDLWNQVDWVKNHDQQYTRFYYDEVGNATGVLDGRGKMWTAGYDLRGRQTFAKNPYGQGTTVAYTKVDTVSQITDAAGRLSQAVYDNLDRLVTFVAPFAVGTAENDKRKTSYVYDNKLQLKEVRDPLWTSTGVGQKFRTQFVFDNFGRVQQQIDAQDAITAFGYNANDQVTLVADALNNQTQFLYDARSRLERERIVLNGVNKDRVYGYDKANNLTSFTDRNGRVTNFQYDALDRLTTETWMSQGNNRTFTFGYNLVDNLTSVVDSQGMTTNFSATFTYDNLHRLDNAHYWAAANLPTNVTKSYQFDGNGNRTQLAVGVVTTDFIQTNTYDDANRLTRMSRDGFGAAADLRVDLAYNPLGQMTNVTRYSDLGGTQQVSTTGYSYEAATGRLGQIAHTKNSTNLATFGYSYDKNDRITQVAGTGTYSNTVGYNYDRTGQLTAADHSAQADENYGWDGNGNPTGSTLTQYNRIASDGVYNYEYDFEGNLTRRTTIIGGAYEEYLWDFRNRLTAVNFKTAGGTLIKQVVYAYDPFNRLLGRGYDADGSGSGQATWQYFVWDGINPLLELNGTGAVTRRHLAGDQVDQLFAEQGTGGVKWYLTDHLGSVRHLTDNNGTVQETLKYDSFGKLLTTPSADTLFAYTGKFFDKQTDLQNNWNRWYRPSWRRWVSEDPIGFAGGDANLQRYVGNGATIATDSTGWFAAPPVEQGHHWFTVEMIGEFIDWFDDPKDFKLACGNIAWGVGPHSSITDTLGTVSHKAYSEQVMKQFRKYLIQIGAATESGDRLRRVRTITRRELRSFIELVYSGKNCDGTPNLIIARFADGIRALQKAHFPDLDISLLTDEQMVKYGESLLNDDRFARRIKISFIIAGLSLVLPSPLAFAEALNDDQSKLRSGIEAYIQGALGDAEALLWGNDSFALDFAGKTGTGGIGMMDLLERTFRRLERDIDKRLERLQKGTKPD